jgi:hypothetical protein
VEEISQMVENYMAQQMSRQAVGMLAAANGNIEV